MLIKETEKQKDSDGNKIKNQPKLLINRDMKYLPFENITFETKLKREEVQKRIKEVTVSQMFGMVSTFESSSHKHYVGTIRENSFSLIRIIRHKNSHFPRIYGVIEQGLDQTKIKVKIKFHIMITIFMFMVFVPVGINCLIALPKIFNSQNFDPTNLLPFAFFIIGYAFFLGIFNYESIKTKEYFTELLEAEIKN